MGVNVWLVDCCFMALDLLKTYYANRKLIGPDNCIYYFKTKYTKKITLIGEQENKPKYASKTQCFLKS